MKMHVNHAWVHTTRQIGDDGVVTVHDKNSAQNRPRVVLFSGWVGLINILAPARFTKMFPNLFHVVTRSVSRYDQCPPGEN